MADFLVGIEEKYTKELLKGRIAVEGNVISCFFKDMLLLDEVMLKNEDFITIDGRFYFETLVKLRKIGCYSLDEITILSNLNEEEINIYNSKGGFETIQNQIDIINLEKFDIYIDTLFRENILLQMHEDGITLSHRISLPNGKKESLLKMFRKMDADSVADWFAARVASYGGGYSKAVLEEGTIDFDDDFLDTCASGIDNGVPFDIAGYDKNGDEMNCYQFLSRQISGLLPGTFSMIGGFSSSGKSTWTIGLILALVYQGRKVLIISNEEDKKKFKVKFLVWLLAKYRRYFNLTKKKLLNSEISEADREEYNKVKEFWKQEYKDKIKFIGLADANVNLAKKKIRENVLRYGYDTVLYDTFKMQEQDFTKNRQDLGLIRDSREFHKLAMKYNIIMLASVQLSEANRGQLFLSAQNTSNSKQLKEILENYFLIRNVYPEELDKKSKYYCKPFRMVKTSEGKWTEKEYDADPSCVWRMLFVEKCRNGANSPDTGNAYLLKFLGDFAMFKECAMCKPKHGTIT